MDQDDFICNVKMRTIYKGILIYLLLLNRYFSSSSECLCEGHLHILKHILIMKSRAEQMQIRVMKRNWIMSNSIKMLLMILAEDLAKTAQKNDA